MKRIIYAAEYKYWLLLNYKYCLTSNCQNCWLLHTELHAFLPSAHFECYLATVVTISEHFSRPAYLGQRPECYSNAAAQLLAVKYAASVRQHPERLERIVLLLTILILFILLLRIWRMLMEERHSISMYSCSPKLVQCMDTMMLL